jgi:hypothetical protein
MRFLAFLPALGIAAFFIGVFYGRSVEREREAPLLKALTDRMRVSEDKLAACSSKLLTETRGADAMLEWYEQCLDGRTCTTAGPGLELWRHFKPPTLPHHSLEPSTDLPVAKNPPVQP